MGWPTTLPLLAQIRMPSRKITLFFSLPKYLFSFFHTYWHRPSCMMYMLVSSKSPTKYALAIGGVKKSHRFWTDFHEGCHTKHNPLFGIPSMGNIFSAIAYTLVRLVSNDALISIWSCGHTLMQDYVMLRSILRVESPPFLATTWFLLSTTIQEEGDMKVEKIILDFLEQRKKEYHQDHSSWLIGHLLASHKAVAPNE